jgi:hypothetical protein
MFSGVSVPAQGVGGRWGSGGSLTPSQCSRGKQGKGLNSEDSGVEAESRSECFLGGTGQDVCVCWRLGYFWVNTLPEPGSV